MEQQSGNGSVFHCSNSIGDLWNWFMIQFCAHKFWPIRLSSTSTFWVSNLKHACRQFLKGYGSSRRFVLATNQFRNCEPLKLWAPEISLWCFAWLRCIHQFKVIAWCFILFPLRSPSMDQAIGNPGTADHGFLLGHELGIDHDSKPANFQRLRIADFHQSAGDEQCHFRGRSVCHKSHRTFLHQNHPKPW